MAGPGGKKNRQKERRLMKGFLSVSGSSSGTTNSVSPGGGKVNHISITPAIPENTEVKLDIINFKKTPTVGINRITKLIGSDKNLLQDKAIGRNLSPGTGDILASCRRREPESRKKTLPG